MKRSTRCARPAEEQERAHCAGTAMVEEPGEDDIVLAKILALIRTLPFGGEGDFPEADGEESRGAKAKSRHAAHAALSDSAGERDGVSSVAWIGSASRSEQACCVCSNLIAAAEAFAGFSDGDLCSVPEEIRDGARGALIGVWKTLDLLKRLEVTRSQLTAEC